MKFNYIKSILLVSVIIFFIFIISVYTKNKKLIQFNFITLNQSNIISEDSLFNYINYNLDSINFFSNNNINNFKEKIYDLEKIGIIKNIKISYSLPNKILVNITNNEPIYIIKTKINKFILDEEGAIYDTQFSSSFFSIPKVN